MVDRAVVVETRLLGIPGERPATPARPIVADPVGARGVGLAPHHSLKFLRSPGRIPVAPR